MIKSIMNNDAGIQAWETYANAKNKKDSMWDKLQNSFSEIKNMQDFDDFQEKWDSFSVGELECRKAFDDLKSFAKN